MPNISTHNKFNPNQMKDTEFQKHRISKTWNLKNTEFKKVELKKKVSKMYQKKTTDPKKVQSHLEKNLVFLAKIKKIRLFFRQSHTYSRSKTSRRWNRGELWIHFSNPLIRVRRRSYFPPSVLPVDRLRKGFIEMFSLFPRFLALGLPRTPPSRA